MEKRIKEIEENLTACKKKNYTKKELLNELFLLQEEMIKETFNSVHAERSGLRLWDVVRYFTGINSECDNVADELLNEFISKSKQFSEMIKGIVSGDKGEYKAYKSLQTLSCNHKLLRSVELRIDNHLTEIDIIAITNQGVYLIEVKNTAKDIIIDERGNYCRITYNGEIAFDKNIGEKMNEKEYVLREVLNKTGIRNIQLNSIVVFTNSNINITNNYEYIKECYLSQLPHIISGNATSSCLSDKQIAKITRTIIEAQCEESYPIKMDIESFMHTFAVLLATLENAKAQQAKREDLEASINKNFFIRMFENVSKIASAIFR